MPDAAFACLDLTTFCRLDELGLDVVGRHLEPERAVLSCRALRRPLELKTAVMDPFHVVRLAGDALDRCRRRVQQDLHGHRGRKDAPL